MVKLAQNVKNEKKKRKRLVCGSFIDSVISLQGTEVQMLLPYGLAERHFENTALCFSVFSLGKKYDSLQ